MSSKAVRKAACREKNDRLKGRVVGRDRELLSNPKVLSWWEARLSYARAEPFLFTSRGMSESETHAKMAKAMLIGLRYTEDQFARLNLGNLDCETFTQLVAEAPHPSAQAGAPRPPSTRGFTRRTTHPPAGPPLPSPSHPRAHPWGWRAPRTRRRRGRGGSRCGPCGTSCNGPRPARVCPCADRCPASRRRTGRRTARPGSGLGRPGPGRPGSPQARPRPVSAARARPGPGRVSPCPESRRGAPP